MARLPNPGGDTGTWGDILNDYLSQSHKPDGTLSDGIVTSSALAPGAITKATVGLADVDNTSDANKPLSTAAQLAVADLDTRLDSLEATPGVLLLEVGEDAGDVPVATPVGTIIFRKV